MTPRVVVSRVRGLFGKASRDADLSEEIQGHLSFVAEEFERRGLSPSEARAAAHRAFGGVEQMKERYRDQRGLPWVERFTHDVRFAVRQLAHNYGFTAAAVLTLALGIGANAAIFSLFRGILLQPLANRDESRLLYIRQSALGTGNENATFSVPEIQDLRGRLRTIASLGEFSTIGFTMVGLGEPRQVRAGVVDGHFFDVMGLQPVAGRLLDPSDDGPNAAGAVVLTNRFWTTSLNADPAVVGKTVRLGSRSAVVVGVLQPSVPYPEQTEIIANIVTSPHHLSATMVTGREHRMTEVFGRLAPGATVAEARAELQAAHGAIIRDHSEAYPAKADFRIDAVPLRDQITSRARTVLLLLLAASGLIFVIACANVANLVLARTVRRESELAVRAALGASTATLRRTLLAESVVLCAVGAALGVLIAGPMVSVLSAYAARFSVRALDLKLDSTPLWVAVPLALLAAVLLAFVPRLPSPGNGTQRTTQASNRRLRSFAVVQIAASFVLLAGAGVLLRTLWTLQSMQPGFETSRVLAVNLPVMSFGRTPEQIRAFYRDVQRRLRDVPGVEQVAVGSTVPWRDVGGGRGLAFTVEGLTRGPGNEDPRARFRSVSPGFFSTLGIRLIAGRDFNDGDTNGGEQVVIVSSSIAQRLFPGQDPINRRLTWTDGIMKFIGVSTDSRRIVGVAADIDDERIDPQSVMTVYHPFDQELGGGRLFVHTRGEPYALVQPITRAVRELAADQPVERAATLDDVKAEVLAPDRLNSIVFGTFAALALIISIVGIAGVLAFSVSGRIREFGVRLAIGSPPIRLLLSILAEGAVLAAAGIVLGAGLGWALARGGGALVPGLQQPGPLPLVAAAAILFAATLLAAFLPAARAARVDPVVALRCE